MKLLKLLRRSSSTATPQNKDTSSIITNAEKIANSESLMKYEAIPGTPFTLGEKDGYSFILLGSHMITEPKKDRKATLMMLNTEKWNIIFRMLITILTNKDEINNINQQVKDIKDRSKQKSA